MDVPDQFSNYLADQTWRYAIVVGLVSIPFTLVLQQQDAGNYTLLPVIVAGLCVGYALNDGRKGWRAGWRTGLIGGLSLLWGASQFATLIPEIPQTLFSGYFAIISLALVTGLYIIVFGVLGLFGSVIGDWLATKSTGYSRQSVLD